MSVQLVGDFTQCKDKPIQMKKDGNGVWKTSVSLQPGTHQYRFIVDGEWRDDPNCPTKVHNQFGSQDAILEVR